MKERWFDHDGRSLDVDDLRRVIVMMLAREGLKLQHREGLAALRIVGLATPSETK